ncbi:hypothetical protein BH20ACI3_BH20ACI3_24280 [soil metagenome]
MSDIFLSQQTSLGYNPAEHPAEHQLMHRIRRVPIDSPKQSDGIEDRGLPNLRGRAFAVNFEFQPRATGQFHLSVEPQKAVRLKRLNAPEVDRIADA